ncbi:MAG: hypothetical protein JWQ71_2634, partial [Pedosphaera sp.]|nr:hypothetical protein [Pedosphaera sp.]
TTENQGEQLLMDGGYVANNPTLFAIADARHAFNKESRDINVAGQTHLNSGLQSSEV